MSNEYPDLIRLCIGGERRTGGDGQTLPVENPATGEVIGRVAAATAGDIEAAAQSSARGFREWSATPAFRRYGLMREAARLLRERAETVARLITLEQGKPLREARAEVALASDLIEWFAEEARRLYGRVIPSRQEGVTQTVMPHPVGPTAAFTPWNFPINQAVRKVSAALAAGCSIVLKGPEETPASCAELVQAFHDAGVPAGVVNLLYGNPAEISSALIAHPVIRKISFTGSTAVGKHLASLAGRHMKRATMELGGHSPVVVARDADVAAVVELIAAAKYRNAGQVCVSPTRFIVHEDIAEDFTEALVAKARALALGSGLDEATGMGPLVNEKRRAAVRSIVADALDRGARLAGGGAPVDGPGYFFEPTVLVDVPISARIMNEEPFGPIAPIVTFTEIEEAIVESNRLDYGLAAYAFARDPQDLVRLRSGVEAGMLTINHLGLSHPELPFGGIKDSGIGSEGGEEALEAYTYPRLVTERAIA